MIAVNQEKLNLKEKDDPFVAFYLDKIKHLKKTASSYSFKHPDALITEPDKDDKYGQERHPTHSIDTKYRFVNDEFDVEVQWYTTSTIVEKGRVNYSPNSILFNGKMTLTTERDVDQIFFLIYICPFMKPEKGFSGQNTARRKNVWIELYDHQKKLENIQEQEEKLAEVKTALWNQKHGIPVGKLRMIAANFGISGVDKFLDAEVRQALDAFVLARRENKYDWDRIAKFIESVDADTEVELGFSVQKAIEDKIIMHVKASKNVPVALWKYTESGEQICETGVRKDTLQALRDYLDRYPDAAKLLIETVK
jgi:hypothetical protein